MLSPWSDEPRDTTQPEVEPNEDAEAPAEVEADAKAKQLQWRLKTPASYFYSSVWMYRDTILCMYPDGTIRTLKVQNTK
jgi:hypothetical protein